MILKWFYFVSALPVLFNMYTDKDSNLISDHWTYYTKKDRCEAATLTNNIIFLEECRQFINKIR